MYKTILQANDGSASADKAFVLALDLAKLSGAELHMICVEEISEFPEIIGEVREEKRFADRRYRPIVRRAEQLAEEKGVKLVTHIVTGHPVRDIIMLAGDLPADLLVIGATGHSTFYERVLGTRADRLVDLSPCPVLVAK
jgi:nucleotide-binding universal stress UspA family protein